MTFIEQWSHPQMIYLLVPMMAVMLGYVYHLVWKRCRVNEIYEKLGRDPEKKSVKKLCKISALAGCIAFVISTIVTFCVPMRFPLLAFICLLILNLSLCGGVIYYIYNYMRTHGFLPSNVSENVHAFSQDPGFFQVRGRQIGTILFFALLVLALMGPEGAEKTTRLRRTPMIVTVLFDLSRSMDADDVKPSRLDVARDEVAYLLEHSYGDDFGLVYFTDTAVVQAPHTPDVRFIQSFLRRAQTDTMPTHGTDLTLALKTALTLFLESESLNADVIPATRHVLLVTDGETHSGDLDALLAKYQDEGIIVDVLAVGTENGAELKDEHGARLMYEGRPVISKLETDLLEQIATLTGGEFSRIRMPEQAAQKILASWDAHRIGHRPRGMMSFLYREQLYAWFLIPAYGLIVLMFVFPGVIWFVGFVRRRYGMAGAGLRGDDGVSGMSGEVK